MSSSRREPLNIEFSESTEFERWPPLQKEINQADLPESLMIEDDLHSLTDTPALHRHCDNSSCIVEDSTKTAQAETPVGSDNTMPSTVSFTYSTKSSDGLELESFSFEGSTSNDPGKNDMAKRSDQAPQAAEPSYPCPVFPDVPDLKADISRAIVASQSDRYRSNTSPQNASLGVYQHDRNHCVRHSQLASDDFNDYYIKMLSAKKKQPPSLQEPPLCSSCSQSMIRYVSAIQTLIQQLSVDIIVKGKDPPDCSWCAREKLAIFQNAWVPHSFGSGSAVLADKVDHKNAKHPSSGLHNEQAHAASPRTQAWQWPPSSCSVPVPGPTSTHDSSKRHIELLSSSQGVQSFPDDGKFQSEDTITVHSQPLSLPAGQVPDVAAPMSNLTTNPLSNAFLPTALEQQSLPKPDQLSHCAPQLSEVLHVSPKIGLSPATSEYNGGVQPSKSDEVIINPHFTESGEQQNSVKRPSELQLHNLGSNLQENLANSGLSLSEHGGARRKPSLSSDWMTDLVQPLIPEPAVPSVRDEAYVTMANNDLSAMLCLVLGNSLWLSRTSRSLVILVTDGVSHAFRHLLSCVFNVVLSVRSLGTQGTTKLALLEQPDIGVSYTKLHAWRLTQFSKCVFLDAGMLVVQNCDELFERDELSAVPDIGWPDCFNSGLFVYVPSMQTFWDLISFAERQGSFDGGDQGLLNTYFRNWSADINRRLPFIYNLMANVCYTYKPAFRQFGQNVKVVQFLGGYKPWNVKFHPPTGTLSPAASVHPTYVQFVQFWIQIFVKRVLPLFSSTIQTKVNEQRYTCALDILQHFPSFLVAEPVVCLPAPSLRTHPKPIIYLPPGPRVAPESTPGTSPPDMTATVTEPGVSEALEAVQERGIEPDTKGASDPDAHNAHTVPKEKDLPKLLSVAVDDNCNILPEASVEPTAVDDLSGMLAWEQGRADYMGEHCSDNIMAKLDELIGPGVQSK